MTTASSTAAAREKVRRLMPIEGDIGFRRRCETVLEFLDPQLGELVLDCGCGYGFTLHVLQALTGARLVGLDLGLDRLRAARERLGGRIAYVRGSAMDLPFADGTFDKIVSSEVLEHLPDDRLAISEMARVLKPGGTLAITVPCADYPAGWDPFNWGLERAVGRHIGGERMFSGIWYGHLRLYAKDQIAERLTSAGLAVTETRGLTHYCPPTTHLFMYGILKPLLMSGRLPKGLARAGDRCGGPSAAPGLAASLAGRALNAIDRLNDPESVQTAKSGYVAIGVRAVKPG